MDPTIGLPNNTILMLPIFFAEKDPNSDNDGRKIIFQQASISQADFEEKIIKLQDGEHIFVKRWDSRKNEHNMISSRNLIFRSDLITLKHAKLSYENGSFFLKDLKSRNGTYIGSTKLKPYQSHKVESQELINFGGLVATVEIPPLSENVKEIPSVSTTKGKGVLYLILGTLVF